MLIRPQQALPLARNKSKLLIFNISFKMLVIQASLSDLYQEKEENSYIFFLFHIFSRQPCLSRCRGSKLALLHMVKEKKTPSLSAQARFAPFSLKVSWSGKSLIVQLYQLHIDLIYTYVYKCLLNITFSLVIAHSAVLLHIY